MNLRDFSKSFMTLAVKPKKDEWNLKVIERETQKVLSNNSIGNELSAYPGTFERDIVAWWIEYKTIYTVVE